MIQFLVNAPRWLFLAALVYAPWAYGCTRPWTIQILDVVLFAVVAFWLVSCALRRMRPYVPWPLGAAALFLVAQGWFMIANAEAFYDRDLLQFNVIKQLLPFAPGAVDRVDAIPEMMRVTALLGALCFATDLAWRPLWRRRLWWTMAVTGISLVICGLGMKIFGVGITSYIDPTAVSLTSFAFYYYHANAGAFINIILPLVGGLTALAFLESKADVRRALWMPGILMCVAGSVATASKGAMSIAAPLLIILGFWFARLGRERGAFNLTPAKRAALIIGGIVVIAAMCLMTWGSAASRWEEFGASKGGLAKSRLLVSQVCFKMMGDSNFFGFGPGNFAITFPHYTGYLGNALFGVWYFAHEDYLQTVVEWGFVGAFVFGLIFFGGIWVGCRALARTALTLPDATLVTMALFSLATVAIHSLFDFPLQIASIQLYVATLLGICWCSPLFAGTGSSARRKQSRSADA